MDPRLHIPLGVWQKFVKWSKVFQFTRYQLSLAVVNAQYNRPVKQLMSRDWSTPLYRIFHIRSHKDWLNIVGRLDTKFILNPPWHNSSSMKFVQMLVN